MQDYKIGEQPNCPACGSSDTQIIVSNGRDMLLDLNGSFSVYSCQECDFRFTFPYLTPPEMERFYPDDYHAYALSDPSLDEITSGFKSFRSKLREALFHNYCWYLPMIADDASILEIGCSNGAFLSKLANGKRTLTGVELNSAAADIARQSGIQIFNVPFEEIDFEEKFDVVFLWMVLEHLYEPHVILSKLSDLLNAQAYLVFSIPNPESIEARWFGKYWYPLDLPRHLNHFSRKWLYNQFESNGFKIEKVVYLGDLTSFMVSLSFVLQENKWAPKLLVNWLAGFEFGNAGVLRRIVLWTFGLMYINITRWSKNSARVIYVCRKV